MGWPARALLLYFGTSVGPLGRRWRSADSLFDDEAWIGARLDHAGRLTPELDARGRAAGHVAGYSYRFSQVLVGLHYLGGTVPFLDPTLVGIQVSDAVHLHGWKPHLVKATGFRLPAIAAVEPGAPREARLAALRFEIERHFRPLIIALRRLTGLSEQSMWRLVADSVAAAFLFRGQRLGIAEIAKVDALAVLKQPDSPLNNRQLQFFDIVIRDEAQPSRVLVRQTYRARGGCCRWYTARPGQLCSTCVLKKPAERDAALEARLRHRLKLPPKIRMSE